MDQTTVERHVAAPREHVWAVITDLDAAPDVIGGITSIERLEGDGFDVGTRWRETRTMFGREASETMEVTAVDPPSSYVVEADGQGAHYRTEFTLVPDDAGTTVRMTFGAQPSGLVGKVLGATMGRLFAGATRKAIEADLDDIARAAEARTPG